jgi:hypothetical protein
MTRRALLLGLIPLLFSSCWKYSTSTSAIPSHIRTIAIPLFEDTTVETDIKERLTDAVIARFVADNKLRIVDTRDADAIIAGVILDVREESLSFTQGTAAREARLWIVARVRFEDLRNRRVIWEEQRMQAWGVYDIETGAQSDREPGIEAAIAKMAEDILNKTIAGW